MAHSLLRPPPPPPSPAPAIAQKPPGQWHFCHFQTHCGKVAANLHHRRGFMYGLMGSGIVWSSTGETANAAQRRPPPPEAQEKKDPNVTGVQAKVLASIKRKEAMKEEIAKLRERGKAIN